MAPTQHTQGLAVAGLPERPRLRASAWRRAFYFLPLAAITFLAGCGPVQPGVKETFAIEFGGGMGPLGVSGHVTPSWTHEAVPATLPSVEVKP